MQKPQLRLLGLFFGLLLSVTSASIAHAVLGEKSTSNQKVKAELRAASQKAIPDATTSTTAKWSVQEIQGDGVTVKEYSDKDGNVFAVSWRGINRPDLSLLLGDYYQEFFSAEQAAVKTKSRAPSETKSARVTVRRSGHMRDMRGFAFLPDKVPAGVNVEELQR